MNRKAGQVSSKLLDNSLSHPPATYGDLLSFPCGSFSFVESGCQYHAFVHGVCESFGGGHGLDYSGEALTSRLPPVTHLFVLKKLFS